MRYNAGRMAFSYGDGADFEAVKQKAEKLYDGIGSVRCPYFGSSPIAFNAKGKRCHHLKLITTL